MSALPDLLPAPLAFGVELALKGTVLLLGAVLLAALLRGAAAAARHLVWTLAVVGLLALPVLSPLLPGVDVPLPRAWTTAAPVLLPPTLAAPPAPPATPRESADAGWPAPLPPAEASAPPALSQPNGASAIPAAPARGSGWEWVLAAWAAGALALLARLALGVGRLWHLSRRAEEVRDLRWSTLAAEVSEDLGLRRPVRLLRGPGAAMPITWGTLRPVVLLPAEADAWPEARRRVVLLHELAHVARGDCLTQLLAQLACALYWFHPLAWHAARRLRTERELACDDRVLGLGTPAPEYAGHLLDVARAFRAGRRADVAAIAMARPSQLEGRLLAVLDGLRDRRPPSRGARLAAGAAALALVLPLAALRPGAPAPAGAAAPPPAAREAAPAPLAAVAPQGSPQERRLAVRSGGTLFLELGADVGARVTGWDREELWVRGDEGRLTVEAVRGGARVAAPQAGRDGRKLEVRVPRRFGVQVHASGGGVELRDLRGRFSGSTGGGGLALSRVQGEARLQTGGGGAMLAASRLEGRVDTGGGGVVLDTLRGGLEIVSRGGSVLTGVSGTVVDLDIEVDVEREGFAYVTGEGGGRLDAVEAIGRNAPPEAAAAALARLAFEDRDVDVQREAAETLGGLAGAHGTAELVRIARTHPAAPVRREAAEALGVKATDDAIAALRELVDRDADRGVRAEAVESLAGAGERTDVRRRTTPAEVRAMVERISRTHRDPAVRRQALEGLGQLDELHELSAEGEPLAPLSRLSPQDDPASERLAPLPGGALRLSDEALRGAPDAAAIRRLRAAAAHRKTGPVDLVRERAEWALSQVRDGRVVETLTAALRSPDWRVRANAAWALGVAEDRRAVAPLVAVLADGTWRVRANAAASLAALPDARAVEPLVRALADAEWQVRAAAADALGRAGDRRAVAPLRTAFRDAHMAVQDAAATSLERLKAQDRA